MPNNTKKRILITSTDVMMLQFLVPHVFNLSSIGYEVEVVCSEVEGHIEELQSIFADKIPFSVVNLSRSPADIKNCVGYKQLRNIIQNGNFDIIWTNEPVMSVITRLAAKRYRKSGLKVLYIAHGFHFYRGAPKINWVLYYSIEKVFSRFTDQIITINEEDFQLAKKKFLGTKVTKIPGIGIDTKRFFQKVSLDTLKRKRSELGITNEQQLFLSVGELEKRKNHVTSIIAFAEVAPEHAKLAICGVGTQKDELEKLITKLGVEERVFLLGYRYDINELCHTADVFLFTSYQEGLSVALMEAMAVGIPCIVSKIRGNVDLIEEDRGIYCDPNDIESVKCAINSFEDRKELFEEAIEYNKSKVKEYDFEKVSQLLTGIIERL